MCYAAGSGEAWAYTLSDLQSYLVQFPASHYSSSGREPLQYATTKNYRVDAPHMAIALSHEQVCRLLMGLQTP